MDYHIARDGQQLGIFSESQIQSNLVNGTCRPTDLAWCEGMTDWKPLAELFPGGESGIVSPPVPQQPAMPVSISSSPTNSGLAIASLVCGIASFFTCGLSGIAGIVCGHMALSRIKKSMGAINGSGMAITGLVTGYIGFFVFTLSFVAGFTIPMIAEIRERGAADSGSQPCKTNCHCMPDLC